MRDSLEKNFWDLRVDCYISQLETRGLHPLSAFAVHPMEKKASEKIHVEERQLGRPHRWYGFRAKKCFHSWSLKPIIFKIGFSLGGLWRIDTPWVSMAGFSLHAAEGP
jgi:hypothetical protein